MDPVSHAAAPAPDLSAPRPASEQEQILELIATRQPLREVLSRLAAVMERSFPGALVSVLLVEGDRRLRLGAAPSLPDEYNAAIDGLEIGPGGGSCGAAAFQREPVVVSDIQSHPYWEPYRELAAEHGLRACWSTPILGGDRVLGTFAVYHTRPHEPSDEELRQVERATHLARIAIEHHIAEQALQDSEARSSAVVKAALDCIMVMDHKGLVREFNPSAERTFGYTREEAIGRSMAELIIPPAMREAHARGLERYLATGEGPVLGQRLALSAVDRSGREFPVELSILDITAGGLPQFVGYLRDTSDQKQAEREREERGRITALNGELGAIVTEGGPIQRVLQRCAEALVTHLDAAFARVWTLNEAAQVLELRASAGIYTHLDGPHSRVPVGSFKIGKIASERAPHLTNDVQNDPRVSDKEWARREGMVAFAGYPLLVEDRLLGVVALFAREPLSDQALEALRLVAERLAATVERRETEERMRRSEHRHRTLIEATAAIVWSTSPAGEFQSEQLRWTEFTGQPADQAAGLGWLEMVHPQDQELTREQWGAAIRAHRLFEGEHRLRRADGEYRFMQVRAVPILDHDGAVAEWVGVHTDITEQRQAQEAQHRLALEQTARREAEARQAQLSQYSEELERSNQELQAFAYVASHDLQEPLRKIRAFGDVLREDFGEALGEEGSQFLQRMQNAAERMQSLINDLLAYSRVTTRAQAFRPVDLDDVARTVLDTLELRIRETGAVVEVEELPTVRADELQMQQLLQNLVGNALKFHQPDVAPRVKVLARPVTDAADGRLWTELVVRDEGIGFDERYLDRIFSIFQRLHGRGGYEGTGVGLAICRKIAERHGGTITARSAPGRGAEFIVRLPIEQPEPSQAT